MLPEGYHCEVRLHRGNRKKRRDAQFEADWDPNRDSIRIEFSPTDEAIEVTGKLAASSGTASQISAEDRLADLLRALDRAERRPGYEFVSLKWFRDAALVHEGLNWAADAFARQDILREAIDRRWILIAALEVEDDLLISVGTVAEALIVAARRNVGNEMVRLLSGVGFEIVSVTAPAARRVAEAYDR